MSRFKHPKWSFSAASKRSIHLAVVLCIAAILVRCGVDRLLLSSSHHPMKALAPVRASTNPHGSIPATTRTDMDQPLNGKLGAHHSQCLLTKLSYQLVRWLDQTLPTASRYSSWQVEAIRLLRLDAPQSIVAGQPVKLRCLYDNKNDRLESLSWYKNGREFFRYQPYERRHPILTFKLPGVNVDVSTHLNLAHLLPQVVARITNAQIQLSKSKNNTVVLTNTTLETSGRYKCEATGNTFQEAFLETFINVSAASSSATQTTTTTSTAAFLAIFTSYLLLIGTNCQ